MVTVGRVLCASKVYKRGVNVTKYDSRLPTTVERLSNATSVESKDRAQKSKRLPALKLDQRKPTVPAVRSGLPPLPPAGPVIRDVLVNFPLPEKHSKELRRILAIERESAKPLSVTVPYEEVDSPRTPQQPTYYFDGRFRKVRSYFFMREDLMSRFKQIWGRSVMELSRYESTSPDVFGGFRRDVKINRVFCNNRPVNSEFYFPQDSSSVVLQRVVHRHEPPVLNDPIEVLCSNQHVMVVNKPCSVPVRHGGVYHHNTLRQILKWDLGITDQLKVLYKCETLASGLVVFAKHDNVYERMMTEFRRKSTKLEYLCLVEGAFPKHGIICNQPIDYLSGLPQTSLGVQMVTDSGSFCQTAFERIAVDEDANLSLVKCVTRSGAPLHQIRVHLQFLGHPIYDDPLYNNAELFGPEKGKSGNYGKSLEDLRQDIMHLARPFDGYEVYHFEEHRQKLRDTKVPKELDVELLEKIHHRYDPYCARCYFDLPDPQIEKMRMSLHLVSCKTTKWSFSTPIPEWALRVQKKSAMYRIPTAEPRRLESEEASDVEETRKLSGEKRENYLPPRRRSLNTFPTV